MLVVMSSISRSTVDCNSTMLHVRRAEELHGRNVVLLQSTVLREMLDITADSGEYVREGFGSKS